MGCFLYKKKKKKEEVVEEPSEALKAVVNGVRVRNEKVEKQREKNKKKNKKKTISCDKRGEFLAVVTEPKQLYHSLLTTQQGWPKWLSAFAPEAIQGWIPRRATEFEKLDKIGQGTYSNVFKAREKTSGKIVALKKVSFDSLNEESVKFMAREIVVLRRLNHPNVIKLEGLVTSRMSSSLYLVFEYMDHDLTGLLGSGITFTEPQVKCYMKQLLSGLEHCHNQGVLHRDIKGSNLLIDNEGVLKIADFGLASFYDLAHRRPMTNRVVTLWYRPPELLLGATSYGIGVDLWSAGCILGELLTGKPLMPGRTEVEQLHMVFKLCGSPSEEYWKKLKLLSASKFKLPQPYKRHIQETFIKFPPPSRALIETLLAMDPDERGTATSALASEFFATKPCACEPSSLPRYPSSKEMDVKIRQEKSRRQRGLSGKGNVDEAKRANYHNQGYRAIPAPEANAELQINLDRWRVFRQADAKSKSEKFPPPHQDGAVGFLNRSQAVSYVAPDASFTSSVFEPKSSSTSQSSFLRNSVLVEGALRRKMNLRIKDKQSVSEVFGG